ncbi:hypothetical protein [Geomicrobium sp. JCM 19039]|uniref:hypothetical protein n=1 Tax=Geomicrobium sp. JCM 19039 TaxID=1460636 RepID=UPI001EE6719F|nr:hypothetical protein [Geomicrobium sp. JCM 19039]
MGDAVAVDKAIRNHANFKDQIYLHRSALPLDEIYFQEDQMDLIDYFNNECEGFCGV